MIASCLNSVGLALDIVGVILLYVFTLPKEFMEHGNTFKGIAGDNEQTRADWRRRKRWTQTAVAVLIVGFLLQIASNFVPAG